MRSIQTPSCTHTHMQCFRGHLKCTITATPPPPHRSVYFVKCALFIITLPNAYPFFGGHGARCALLLGRLAFRTPSPLSHLYACVMCTCACEVPGVYKRFRFASCVLFSPFCARAICKVPKKKGKIGKIKIKLIDEQ